VDLAVVKAQFHQMELVGYNGQKWPILPSTARR
jgi:hypothetical protein